MLTFVATSVWERIAVGAWTPQNLGHVGFATIKPFLKEMKFLGHYIYIYKTYIYIYIYRYIHIQYILYIYYIYKL